MGGGWSLHRYDPSRHPALRRRAARLGQSVDAHVTQPAARNTRGSVLAIWFLLLVVSTGIALGGGLRINLSGSMPAGCYRLTATKIERVALVAACPYLTFRRATGAGTGLSGPRS